MKQQAWLRSGSLHCSGTKSPANLIPEQHGNKLKGGHGMAWQKAQVEIQVSGAAAILVFNEEFLSWSYSHPCSVNALLSILSLLNTTVT